MCDIIGMQNSIPITMLDIYMYSTFEFENYVNYAGSKTHNMMPITGPRFENYVNYAGSKTLMLVQVRQEQFENYVNYAGSKTTFFLQKN